MTVINLDRKTIAALPEGEGLYWDKTLRGFGYLCRRDASGTIRRSWIVQYRIDGRQRKPKIADANRLNADQARKRATEMLAKVALGIDPAAEKDAQRAAATAMTFAAATELFLDLKKLTLRPSSLRMATLYLTSTRYFPTFHAKPLDKITRSDVSAALDKLYVESGPDSASRARAHLNMLYVWCMQRGHAQANPVVNTEAPKGGDARERVLSNDELRAVWNACDMQTDFGKIVRLLILLGCRRQEIGSLQWSWLDLDRGLMTIPATITKNHRELVLALPPMALDVICSVPQRVGNDHVFGERDNGFNSWQYAKRLLNDGITKPWRLHDIRRSVATGMCELGVDPHVVESVLNHISGHKGGVAGIYNRASYAKQMKTALQVWSDHVRDLVEVIEVVEPA